MKYVKINRMKTNNDEFGRKRMKNLEKKTCRIFGKEKWKMVGGFSLN